MTLLPPERSWRADSGSIVLGWLGRLTITFAVLGLVGFEVLSIAVTHVGIQDIGVTAGDRALTAYQESKNPAIAYSAADQYASEHSATIVKKTFLISDQSVSFEITKTAPTLLLYRWDKTAGYAEVSTKIYEEPIEESGTMS
jgi:hypothetical protein